MDLLTDRYVTNAFNSILARLNQLNPSERQQNILLNQNEEEVITITNGTF